MHLSICLTCLHHIICGLPKVSLEKMGLLRKLQTLYTFLNKCPTNSIKARRFTNMHTVKMIQRITVVSC